MKVDPTKERLDAPVLIAVRMLRSPAVKPPPALRTADIVICDSKNRSTDFGFFEFVVSFPSRGGLTSRPGRVGSG